MRSIRWVLALVIACGCALGTGCSIDREPPKVVRTAERVEADSDELREDDQRSERVASYTEAAARDGGLVFGAQVQAGSGAYPAAEAEEDAGAGCEPAAR